MWPEVTAFLAAVGEPYALVPFDRGRGLLVRFDRPFRPAGGDRRHVLHQEFSWWAATAEDVDRDARRTLEYWLGGGAFFYRPPPRRTNG